MTSRTIFNFKTIFSILAFALYMVHLLRYNVQFIKSEPEGVILSPNIYVSSET